MMMTTAMPAPQRDVDAAFMELVLADDELVRLEFEALMQAGFGARTPSLEPPASEPARPACGAALESRPTRCASSQTTTALRRRGRERSPP